MDFLKNNTRFSFQYDGKDFAEYPHTVDQVQEGETLTTVYTFESGLRVTNIAKKYKKFGAYEWVNWFENTSDQPTGIISELFDCHCQMPMEHEEFYVRNQYLPDKKSATKIYAPGGSTWEADEFVSYPDQLDSSWRINHCGTGQTKTYAASGGRSSEKQAPFFNIHKNGKGYIAAIGWSGQWNCSISREEDTITLKTKIEDTHFRLLPGEKIRTSSVVILPYEGDVIDSQNMWRRLVKEEFSLVGQPGRDAFAPLCASNWGGQPTEVLLKAVDQIQQGNIPFEYFWVDAGWYGINTPPSISAFEDTWGGSTGDWRVSPHIHPNGMKVVSDAVHKAGMKFLLWFEPEHVIRNTPIAQEHPEYFFAPEGEWHRLLNLGNPEAWEYCYNTLADLFEELEVDCYRQDFNMSPLPYWRASDAEDRQGISEIKHIMGMYRLWDALLERFPHLLIDNCASGGRRLDIETLRRSVPLWRSDLQCHENCDIESTQMHHLGFNTWMPYSGTGGGDSFDHYRFRSAYSACLQVGHFFYSKTYSPDKLEYLRKYMSEYLELRPYFSEDFYPLTEICECTDVWSGAQFNRPEYQDGIVELFRRENSPYATATFQLRGLQNGVTYRFTDIDDGSTFDLDGEQLNRDGFTITIPDKRCAKIYRYSAI